MVRCCAGISEQPLALYVHSSGCSAAARSSDLSPLPPADTEVEEYLARYPNIPAGSMKRVYNSNMAAIDDSIGVMRAALEEHKAKFGNRTLIVFSQGAQMALSSRRSQF